MEQGSVMMRRRIEWVVAGGAMAALLVGPAAFAQGLPPASGAPSAAASADNASIVTVDIENDAVAGTDRDYSSGLRLNYVSPVGDLPDFASRAGRVLYGAGDQRISIGLSQSIFTPANTQIDPPDPHDRPYAAELTANFALIQDHDDWRSVLGVDLGMVGPAALGQELQNGFHGLIGDTPNRGWGYQIHNEPIFEVTSARIYREPLGNIGPLETDILPELAIGLGNERVYGMTGAQIRIGQGLASDFGASRISPGLSGTDAYQPNRGFVWYAFAGLDGQAVAHDITIDGNTFRDSAHTTGTPFIAEGQAGLAVMAYGFKLAYTEVVQTHEYRNEPSGLFQYGVFTLSTRF
jgi:lipid A 3-O-deacylase